jgi:2-polyprenyl-6-methoxyphenol hydroxylase-like FAD-dependent oxidoreductase
VASWTRSFPLQADLFRRIRAEADWPRVAWAPFQIVKLHRWSQGHVAIVGDAAHSMPPNLGQGGACTMMNALSLAVALEEVDDVPLGLQRWEQRERPLTDHAQRWSRAYSMLNRWPYLAQSAALKVLNLPPVQARCRRAARHISTGTVSRREAVNASTGKAL